MPEIYEPAEDSYLMAETLSVEIPKLLRNNSDLKFLEMGCGSGINLIAVKNAGVKNENIMGCDINPKAVANCKKLGFNCIKSDLFENVDGKFDLIVFNPPYLPLDKKEPKFSRVATTGGFVGTEIIIRFLEQAKSYLNKKGRIFLITSSLSPDVDFNGLGYNAKEIGFKKIFFEKLFVWECLRA